MKIIKLSREEFIEFEKKLQPQQRIFSEREGRQGFVVDEEMFFYTE